jgi:fermentation-respiration switch protein FrsA (DUF1100 family)
MRATGKGVLLLLLLLGVLLAWWVSSMWIDSMIFFPERWMPAPPGGVEERWFDVAGGPRLHAWHAPASASAPVLIWSHGNGGNIAGRAEVLLALNARGLDVFAYDYRGYGKSGGTPSEAGVYEDVLTVFDAVRAGGVSAERIVCFGESLGGAVSIYLANQRPCAGVAVVSTFTRLRDVARSHFGPLAAAAGDRFDSLGRIGNLRVPMLIAHGDRDEIVPFELGERLYSAAPGIKRFLRVRGAHHNDVFASDELLDEIAAFAFGVTRDR